MAALLSLTTISKLLFGTDIPYMKAEFTVSRLGELGLSASDIRAIERDNALEIMPSLRR
jgi:predicted TIM-barrel fold metal-dependent hydrolase